MVDAEKTINRQANTTERPLSRVQSNTDGGSVETPVVAASPTGLVLRPASHHFYSVKTPTLAMAAHNINQQMSTQEHPDVRVQSNPDSLRAETLAVTVGPTGLPLRPVSNHFHTLIIGYILLVPV